MGSLDLWDGWDSIYEVCFSLNKSTSYLSLCLLLNSFHTETQRTRDSVSPEARWVFKLKGHGVKSQSRFRLGSSPSSWVQVSIRSVWFQFQLVSITDSVLCGVKRAGLDLSQRSEWWLCHMLEYHLGRSLDFLLFHFPHLKICLPRPASVEKDLEPAYREHTACRRAECVDLEVTGKVRAAGLQGWSKGCGSEMKSLARKFPQITLWIICRWVWLA